MRYIALVMFVSLCLFHPSKLPAGGVYTIEWADTFGTENNDYASGIAVDGNGSVYVTGNFLNGSNEYALTVGYDSSGNTVWVDTFDNRVNVYTSKVAVDNLGNIYIAGYYYDGVLWNYIIIKYDTQGNFIEDWLFNNGYDDYAQDIGVDGNGNVYVTGSFSDGVTSNYLTIKYDSLGNIVWVDTFDSNHDDFAYGVDVDRDGNVYVTGYFYNGSNNDYLTVVYDASGNVVRVDTFDTGRDDYGRGIAVDSAKNVYVTGYFYTGSGYASLSIKYDASGNVVWVDTFGSVNGDYKAYGVDVDNKGNAYVAGIFHNGTDNDYLTVVYDSSGNVVWADTLDTGGNDHICGIAVDRKENIYVTGYFDRGGDIDYLTIKYRGHYKDAGFLSIASSDTVCTDSVYIPSVWIRNNSDEDTLILDVLAYIDSQNVHVYTDMKSISSLFPGESARIDFDPWQAPSEEADFILSFSILTSDDNPDNDTISQPLYVRDLIPPVIDSAVAFDGTVAESGIDDDDYVIIYFSEPTNKPAIDNSNINSVLSLSNGHSWLDGFGGLGDCLWNPDGTQLLINLSTNISLPTVEVGDTIYPDGATIQDVNGNPCASPCVLGGSFDPSGIEADRLKNNLYLEVSMVNRGGLSIFYHVREDSPYTIEIYGVDGRKVREIAGNKRGIYKLKVENLQVGIYFVRLSQGTESVDRRILITR